MSSFLHASSTWGWLDVPAQTGRCRNTARGVRPGLHLLQQRERRWAPAHAADATEPPPHRPPRKSTRARGSCQQLARIRRRPWAAIAGKQARLLAAAGTDARAQRSDSAGQCMSASAKAAWCRGAGAGAAAVARPVFCIARLLLGGPCWGVYLLGAGGHEHLRQRGAPAAGSRA
jgi:hypothetical protein